MQLLQTFVDFISSRVDIDCSKHYFVNKTVHWADLEVPTEHVWGDHTSPANCAVLTSGACLEAGTERGWSNTNTVNLSSKLIFVLGGRSSDSPLTPYLAPGPIVYSPLLFFPTPVP